MSEQSPTTNQSPDNSVSGYYENYSETQREVYAMEVRKARNALFWVAIILFASELLGLAVTKTFSMETFLISLIVPAIIVGLGFLAVKEAMTAIIIAAVVILGIWIYSIAVLGGRAAISGWLVKAVIIYFLIAGFQHAKEAMRIKKEVGIK